MMNNPLPIRDYLVPGKRAHLVGIGGVSMCPLAEVLRGMGLRIQGSDMSEGPSVQHLKSLGIPGIYHHIYDLGTIGQFIAVGKERMIPVVDKDTGEIRPGKILTIMVVADERICDGLYYARSMRLYRRLLENPRVLETPLDEVERDID